MAQSAFDGKWTTDVTRPAPLPKQHLDITLKTTDGKVTGGMMIQGVPAEAPIEWGMISGDSITFKVKMPFNNVPTVFVYVGRRDGDKIMFGRRPEDQTQGVLVEFVATKEK